MNNQEHITIFGRLGKKPELTYTKKLEAVCQFTLAEKVIGSDVPKWHRVVLWGKLAEHCSVILRKGVPVFVHGRIKEREFKNFEGETRRYRELNGDNLGLSAL